MLENGSRRLGIRIRERWGFRERLQSLQGFAQPIMPGVQPGPPTESYEIRFRFRARYVRKKLSRDKGNPAAT